MSEQQTPTFCAVQSCIRQDGHVGLHRDLAGFELQEQPAPQGTLERIADAIATKVVEQLSGEALDRIVAAVRKAAAEPQRTAGYDGCPLERNECREHGCDGGCEADILCGEPLAGGWRACDLPDGHDGLHRTPPWCGQQPPLSDGPADAGMRYCEKVRGHSGYHQSSSGSPW